MGDRRRAEKQALEQKHAPRFRWAFACVALLAALAFGVQQYLNNTYTTDGAVRQACLDGYRECLNRRQSTSWHVGSFNGQMIGSMIALAGIVLYLALTPRPSEK